MRATKSRLISSAIAAFVGACVAAGCSASGESGDFQATAGGNTTEPEEGGSKIPPPSLGDDDDDLPPDEERDGSAPKNDAGKKDGGKTDSGPPDGGLPRPPDTGQPCSVANELLRRSCGACGTEEAVCLANSSGTGGIVGKYSECRNQTPGGCLPGTTEQGVACGNCGTTTRTCDNTCKWKEGQCSGQPTNSCTPGAIQLVSAHCTDDLYLQRSCRANCSWENYTETCTAPPAFVNVPPTVGSVNSTVAVLSANKKIARLDAGKCPVAISSVVASYAYIEVRNPNPKPVIVTIYNSTVAPSGSVLDTAMTVYPGSTVPTSEAERKACKGTVNNYGTKSLTGDSAWASLDGAGAVSIPAGGKVVVYVTAWGPAITGPAMLNVRTDSIAP